MDAEVRTANDLEVVGQARVRDREVVRREIGGFGVLVDEAGIRIVEDLAVTMILHHDHLDVVEVRNTGRNRAFGGEGGTGERDCEQAQGCDFLHGVILWVCCTNPVRINARSARSYDRMRHKLGERGDFRVTGLGHCGDNDVAEKKRRSVREHGRQRNKKRPSQ
jgi:hypothetical protein